MFFQKYRNTKIQVYTIQHLELETIKLLKHVVSFIGKELAEDCRYCHPPYPYSPCLKVHRKEHVYDIPSTYFKKALAN